MDIYYGRVCSDRAGTWNSINSVQGSHDICAVTRWSQDVPSQERVHQLPAAFVRLIARCDWGLLSAAVISTLIKYFYPATIRVQSLQTVAGN